MASGERKLLDRSFVNRFTNCDSLLADHISLLLSIVRYACCNDSACLRRIDSNRDANSHAGLERCNGGSLSVHCDFAKSRDRECSCHFIFRHSNRVPGDAGNNRRLILRRGGRFLLFTSGKSWRSRQRGNENAGDNQ
jgi:hypothetical protein